MKKYTIRDNHDNFIAFAKSKGAAIRMLRIIRAADDSVSFDAIRSSDFTH